MTQNPSILCTTSKESETKNWEEDQTILPYLEKLRSLLQEDPCGKILPDDEFLCRFIRARKFDTERAHQSIKRYFYLKRKHYDLLKDQHPSTYTALREKNIAVVLKNRDDKGRKVLLLRASKWNPDDVELLHGFIAILLIIEEMATYLETQCHGISIILDCNKLNFYQARKLTPRIIRLIFEVVKDTLPVSFQEIHIVNNPKLVNWLIEIAKPFIKKKLLNRFFFHSYDMEALHKFVNPKILPKSLRGNLTNTQAWDEEFMETLFARNDYYKDFMKFVVGDPTTII